MYFPRIIAFPRHFYEKLVISVWNLSLILFFWLKYNFIGRVHNFIGGNLTLLGSSQFYWRTGKKGRFFQFIAPALIKVPGHQIINIALDLSRHSGSALNHPGF